MSANRTAIVTGATGGLGTPMVRTFLGAGYTVAGIATSGTEVDAAEYRHIVGDLGNSAGADAAISQAAGELGGSIDVLVHTVGGFAGGDPVHRTTDDVWTRMFTMNVTSTFYVLRAVLQRMVARGSGRVIAIGSRVGVQPASGLSAYGASKAAMNALIQTAALEVRDSGITVNALLPSTIDTPANRSWGKPEDIAKWVTPESIAKSALWLASDAAADINGALIPIYGRA